MKPLPRLAAPFLALAVIAACQRQPDRAGAPVVSASPATADRSAAAPAAQTTAPPCAQAITRPTQVPDDQVTLSGGTFRMGTPDSPDLPDAIREHRVTQGEAPVHQVTVAAFAIDRHEVTTAQFARFVRATGYRTEAEGFGWSGVFDVEHGVWAKVNGATWRQPEGPAAAPAADDEPVTQVSWTDAAAYARWAGGRLPTEAEWEYAARGGLDAQTFVWGPQSRPGGRLLGNWWQGSFPERNTGEDGFIRRAPIGHFAANGYGLSDMAGNVWEWCADWFDRGYYAHSARENPTGPSAGTQRVIRGGSFLCADNFCANYRPGARSSATPDSGLDNVGFRIVRPASAASDAAAQPR